MEIENMNAEEFVYHECFGTLPIMVPTYPRSEKLKEIMVCLDCEPHWREYCLSSPASFFESPPTPTRPEDRENDL